MIQQSLEILGILCLIIIGAGIGLWIKSIF